MTLCQTCGAPTTATPALCDDCRAERARHGRAKAAARWTAMRSRLEKRRWTELEPRRVRPCSKRAREAGRCERPGTGATSAWYPPPGRVPRTRPACTSMYRHRGSRPFVVCDACGADARVPTLALGIAPQGQFTDTAHLQQPQEEEAHDVQPPHPRPDAAAREDSREVRRLPAADPRGRRAGANSDSTTPTTWPAT